jgi:hypothetical protein
MILAFAHQAHGRTSAVYGLFACRIDGIDVRVLRIMDSDNSAKE